MSALDYEADNLSDRPANEPAASHDTLIIVFNEQGTIVECSANSVSIVGYTREELISQHISRLVPHLATVPLFVHGEFNPQVSFLSHCDMPFRINHRNGSTFDGMVSVVQLHQLSGPAIRMLILPQEHAHAPGTMV